MPTTPDPAPDGLRAGPGIRAGRRPASCRVCGLLLVDGMGEGQSGGVADEFVVGGCGHAVEFAAEGRLL